MGFIMGEAKRRKSVYPSYGKTTKCEFSSDLSTVFTGKHPGLDKIATENLDIIPEYAVKFVLNKKDAGILFFNTRQSAICWIGKPSTVANSSETVFLVKSLYEKKLESVQVFFEYI